MRTTTAAEDHLLQLPARGHRVRVKIDRGAGVFVDMTSLEGYNWVTSVKVANQVDNPTKTAQVQLHREIERLSLATLVDGSKLNAAGTIIDVARAIVIEAATLPVDVLPVEADWKEIFRGEIDEVDWSGAVSLTCRDEGAALMDQFIRTQRIYGSTGGELLEDVSQDIIDDANFDLDTIVANYTWNNSTTVTMSDTSEVVVGDYIGYLNAPFFEISAIVPNTSVTILNPASRTIPTGSGANNSLLIPDASKVLLYSVTGDATTPFKVADSPGWAIKSFKSGRNYLLPTLRGLAQQIGWECVYRWNDNISAFGLTLYEPDRAAATPDWTHGVGLYSDPTQLAINRATVRNWVEVTFGRAGNRATTIKQNSGSQTKYGFRPMMISEASSSQIDTVGEADDMALAALTDLKDPGAIFAVVVPFLWACQVGDYHRFTADERRFDTDQDLAVVGYEHSFTAKGGATKLTTRGKPSGGVKRWLEIEGRPGIAPANDHQSDSAADNVSVTAGMGTLIITYDDPRTMDPPIDDWAITECYVKAGSGTFTPGAATLRDIGRRLRFQIDGLTPGETYSVILQILDSAGNIGASTTYIAEATQRVGPYHENIDGQQDLLLRNNDFNIWTQGTAVPPDFWGTEVGVWDTDMEEATGDALTGGHVVEMFPTAIMEPELLSEFIPIAETELLDFGVLAKVSAGAAETLTLAIEWFNSAQASISSDSQVFTLATTYTFHQAATVQAPANTRFCKLSITADYLASSTTVYVDRASVTRGYVNGSVIGPGINHTFSTSYYVAEWGTSDVGAEDVGVTHIDNGTPAGGDYDGIQIDFDGIYMFSARSLGVIDDNNFLHEIEIQIDEGGGGSWTTIASSSSPWTTAGNYTVADVESGFLRLYRGDELRVRIKQSTTTGTTKVAYLLNATVRQIVRFQ